MDNKKNLRKYYKEKRDALFKEGFLCGVSREIAGKLNKIFKNINAKHIMLFYPFGSELNVLDVLEAPENKDRKFYLPVCNGEKMLVCPYKSGDELVLNKYKIPEPKTEPLKDIGILDVVITPALCADKNFERLGYGGGYYDRFFADKNLRAKKIVIIPDDFLVETLPKEEFDVKCDIILTEKTVLKRETISDR